MMRALILAFEVALFAMIATFIATQMLIPIMRGTLLFPAFRKETKIKEAIAEVKQELREEELEEKLEELQGQLQEHAEERTINPEGKQNEQN